MIEITKSELATLLNQAANLGAQAALSGAGLQKPFLSKTEAFKKYGEAVVLRWIKEELITARQDGPRSSKWRLDRVELEAVAKASNRRTYVAR